jgi:peptidoglycan hydrolase-like protein with peptidoglycan-binding domain
MQILKVGSKGDAVQRWQAFLVGQGLNIGVDGDFGANTLKATKAFQENNGLDADGVVGHDTFLAASKLGLALDEPAAPAGSSADKVLIRTLSKDGVHLFKLTSGGVVFFTANMAVDADGCPKAYHPGDTGIDAIANSGGLKPNIVAFDPGTHEPYIQKASDPAPGFYTSMTSWQSTDLAKVNPRKYVDALTVPYVVIPGGNVGGAAMGNPAIVIDLNSNRRVSAVVADGGPSEQAGEASMFCAGLISGLPASEITEALARKHASVINPRNGGPSGSRFRYIIFTGVHVPWGSGNGEIDTIAQSAWSGLTDDQRVVLAG